MRYLRFGGRLCRAGGGRIGARGAAKLRRARARPRTASPFGATAASRTTCSGTTSVSRPRRRSMRRVTSKAIKDLYATNQFDDVIDVVRGGRRKDAPRLSSARAPRPERRQGRRTGQGLAELRAGPRRPSGRQADRPGAGREGRRPHRLAVPERGLLPRQGPRRHDHRVARPRRSCFGSTKGVAWRSPASRSSAIKR